MHGAPGSISSTDKEYEFEACCGLNEPSAHIFLPLVHSWWDLLGKERLIQFPVFSPCFVAVDQDVSSQFFLCFLSWTLKPN